MSKILIKKETVTDIAWCPVPNCSAGSRVLLNLQSHWRRKSYTLFGLRYQPPREYLLFICPDPPTGDYKANTFK